MKSILPAIFIILFISRALAISPSEAADHVGEVATVEGDAVCFDLDDNTIIFGVRDGRRKRPVFRAVLEIGVLDLNKYMRELVKGSWSLAITGRIELDKAKPKHSNSWDWEGGPQIVVTDKSQIQGMRRTGEQHH